MKILGEVVHVAMLLFGAFVIILGGGAIAADDYTHGTGLMFAGAVGMLMAFDVLTRRPSR
jgi:hypothetical protein